MDRLIGLLIIRLKKIPNAKAIIKLTNDPKSEMNFDRSASASDTFSSSSVRCSTLGLISPRICWISFNLLTVSL
jgi:hypothetical protein